MIALMHVATGAAAGAIVRSRLAAIALGPALHLAGDYVPHRDFDNQTVDLGTGVTGAVLLALRHGPTHPVTLGALGAAAPDLEHLFPILRPGGAKLFHGRRGWHRSGRLSAGIQVYVAIAIIATLAVKPPRFR
jgi:hypothetical protein